MSYEDQPPVVEKDPWSAEPASRQERLAQRAEKDTAASCNETQPTNVELAFAFVRHFAQELSAGQLSLPSLPGVVVRIKSVLEDDDSTADTIARVVGSEPALAARLLTMANSAAYNRSGIEVTDLKSAVSRLGHDVIRTSAMSFAMQNLMAAETVAQLKPHLSALWKHSITVAAMANVLGKRAKGVNADEAMFVGLIHDIGKLYILSRIGAHPQLFECPEALAELMRDWHAEIGKAIVENWAFAAHVAEAVSHHEEADRHKYGSPDLIDVLVAANLLANARDDGGFAALDFEQVSAFSRLGIDAANAESFVAESQQEIDALMGALRG